MAQQGSLEADAALLVARIARHDEAALAELYDLLAARVLGLVRRIVRDLDEAEQVCGDVFVEVWRTADRAGTSRGAVAWVLGLAHRRAVAHARHTRHPLTSVQAHEEPDGHPGHDRVLELAYYGGHPVRDVAQALGIPVAEACARLRTALGALGAPAAPGSGIAGLAGPAGPAGATAS
ncbi:sigma factor [Terrabacter sp. NPDC000476]|uniref:sigma factor n=1 Tax=Terrabacter sp. NPDC000476 TaxID=3154258 RepID=UPI00333281FF